MYTVMVEGVGMVGTANDVYAGFAVGRKYCFNHFGMRSVKIEILNKNGAPCGTCYSL